MMETLADLKKRNAKEEQNNDSQPLDEKETDEKETDEQETDEQETDEQETGEQETGEQETDEKETDEKGTGLQDESQEIEEGSSEDSGDDDDNTWMQAEGSEKKFTDGDVANAKRKLKGRLSKQNTEMDAMRAEIELLKTLQATPATVQSPDAAPTREQFYEHEDPDTAYINAVVDHKTKQALSVSVNQSRHTQAEQSHRQAIDDHYNRVAALMDTSGIDDQLYQDADNRVRQAVDQATAGQGDLITDQLIAALGAGSEKVMYYLGRNPTALQGLRDALVSDGTGLKAIAYMSRKSGELSAPSRARTQAPKPSAKLKGDKPGTALKTAQKLKKTYQEAHKKGDLQAAFNARREAKKTGVAVDTW